MQQINREPRRAGEVLTCQGSRINAWCGRRRRRCSPTKPPLDWQPTYILTVFSIRCRRGTGRVVFRGRDDSGEARKLRRWQRKQGGEERDIRGLWACCALWRPAYTSLPVRLKWASFFSNIAAVFPCVQVYKWVHALSSPSKVSQVLCKGCLMIRR